MTGISKKFLLLIWVVGFVSLPQFVSAQDTGSSGNVYVLALLIIIGTLILVSVLLLLSEHFMAMEGKKYGIKESKGLNLLIQGSLPSYIDDNPIVTLTKGHDILLNGDANNAPIVPSSGVKRFAIRPQDFRILAPIPKVIVNVGDEVKAGDVIFHDKRLERIKFVAPVSGEVVEVRRGEKRSITEVVILADKEIRFKQMDPPSIIESSREDIVEFLLGSGAWPLINQRPFDLTPDPDQIPENIFISTFDTAPLAPDLNKVVDGKEQFFQQGLNTLARLTSGAVHLGLSANGAAPHAAYREATGVKKTYFKGKHPSGNVGVQIHHTSPIKNGTTVWTLAVQDVITIGELMYKGIFNASRVIAVTGANVKNPSLVRTYLGASVTELIGENLTEGKSRVIAGDVLSGEAVQGDRFMPMNADQITVITEGDYYEMFGWLLPLAPRPTISKTFPNFLYPNHTFDGDTNTHGEKRAFVVSGEYEKVLPMNIYPQHLMKAIMTGDFEQMEGLGIYELSEEDVALCEFVCTSKMPLQNILRDGLEMIREQG